MAIVLGLFMTWGIGANDVANAMGTSVGSGAITVGTAIIIATIFEFAGAAIAGGNVTSTIRSNIVHPATFVGLPDQLALGMLSALFAAGTWLLIASWRGWPVSTTHSIIGAIIGFAIVSAGIASVNWGESRYHCGQLDNLANSWWWDRFCFKNQCASLDSGN